MELCKLFAQLLFLELTKLLLDGIKGRIVALLAQLLLLLFLELRLFHFDGDYLVGVDGSVSPLGLLIFGLPARHILLFFPSCIVCKRVGVFVHNHLVVIHKHFHDILEVLRLGVMDVHCIACHTDLFLLQKL